MQGAIRYPYINAVIGKLSAVCACAVTASTAAATALVKLWGGTEEQMGFAIRNMTGTVSGIWENSILLSSVKRLLLRTLILQQLPD